MQNVSLRCRRRNLSDPHKSARYPKTPTVVDRSFPFRDQEVLSVHCSQSLGVIILYHPQDDELSSCGLWMFQIRTMENFNDKGVVSLSITSKLDFPSYKNDIHDTGAKRIIFTARIQCTRLTYVAGVERSGGSGGKKKGNIRERGKGLHLPFALSHISLPFFGRTRRLQLSSIIN